MAKSIRLELVLVLQNPRQMRYFVSLLWRRFQIQHILKE